MHSKRFIQTKSGIFGNFLKFPREPGTFLGTKNNSFIGSQKNWIFNSPVTGWGGQFFFRWNVLTCAGCPQLSWRHMEGRCFWAKMVDFSRYCVNIIRLKKQLWVGLQILRFLKRDRRHCSMLSGTSFHQLKEYKLIYFQMMTSWLTHKAMKSHDISCSIHLKRMILIEVWVCRLNLFEGLIFQVTGLENDAVEEKWELLRSTETDIEEHGLKVWFLVSVFGHYELISFVFETEHVPRSFLYLTWEVAELSKLDSIIETERFVRSA